MAKATIRLCPNCGSPKHHAESDISFLSGNEPAYVCDSCGFQARIFPQVDLDEVERFEKQVPKKKVKGQKPRWELHPAWFLLPVGILVAFLLFLTLGVVMLVIVVPIVGAGWLLGRKKKGR